MVGLIGGEVAELEAQDPALSSTGRQIYAERHCCSTAMPYCGALPAELWRKYRLDEPGAQLEIVEREDGVIELRPTLPVSVDEMWFWTEGHQAAERQAEEDLKAGRYRTFDDAEEFLADLESLASEPER